MAGAARSTADSLTALESASSGQGRTPGGGPPRPWDEHHVFVRYVLRRVRDFDFFQLLHLVERIASQGVELGQQGPARREVVRLRPRLSLGFPPGDLDSAEWRVEPDGTGRLVLTATFLGLYGSDSPLPNHVTESLLGDTEEDRRVRDFLDIFHHRIYSLLYRVWRKYRYYVTFRPDGRDPISIMVRGLLGLGTRGVDEALRIHPVRLFRYVGLLSQKPRSASGLMGQLSDYFDGLPVEIESCVGRWLRIQPGDLNVLGQRKCTLGQDFLLGERLYDRSGKFRVRIGPVGFDDYVRFLPPSRGSQELAELVRFYCEDPLECDVQVTLRGDQVPETPLGEHGMLGRLAWTSWLKSAPCGDKSVVLPVGRPASERS